MLKQRLQQKLLQKLSPQQIQLIKLLEVPTIQLEQRIKKELEENPILEEGREENPDFETDGEVETSTDNEKDEFSIEDYIEDDELPSYRLNSRNYSKDDERTAEIPFTMGVSFKESLTSQLGLRKLSEEDESLGQYILGNIDDDGYLRRDIENIVDDLAFSMNITASEEKLEEILKIIQDFDPAGVGARSLQECLLLQIDRSLKTDKSPDDTTLLARKILQHHFDEFTKKHYDKIMSRLDIDDKTLKEAVDRIIKLNPKPGGSYNDPTAKVIAHIVPDFVLEDNEGDLVLSLNSRNAPDLRINQTYANMLMAHNQERKDLRKAQKEAATFVRHKIDSAKWFIDAIRQRQHTLILTMNAILEFQRPYFESGDEVNLKPMILKDIAEKTQLDISTISRVANSKYIHTYFGIFPLKYFFSEGLQTDSGEEVSTREIKKILEECIADEEKRKPLTDDKLAVILKEKGYLIARRTVAKYREQLNIPVARLRKEL
ncbi:MAG: RNA polymerase factor sigma-54 [Bacteroidales bacterium]|nr:RNA polymerase factor sigma-54 [Bacteroidales bacterium]